MLCLVVGGRRAAGKQLLELENKRKASVVIKLPKKRLGRIQIRLVSYPLEV